MLKVDEVILVDDPNRLLQYERGVFEVVSPSGERARVICPVHGHTVLKQSADTLLRSGNGWWRIRKISET